MIKKKAVIFDLDGVISDTQKFHAEAESILLKEFGIDMKPEEITKKYAGIEDKKMFDEIFKAHDVKIKSLKKVIFRKWNVMKDVTSGRITEIPHAGKLIKKLKKAGFKLAIASASTKNFIIEVTNALKITDYFDTFISAEEVENGKPSPDIFLLTADRLGIDPNQSVVIEDGISGMIGANAANMKSIGLVSNTHDDYPATRIVTSLNDINLQMIHDL